MRDFLPNGAEVIECGDGIEAVCANEVDLKSPGIQTRNSGGLGEGAQAPMAAATNLLQ